MKIINLIRRLLNKFYYVYANRSDKSKLQYLRKLGCKVGDGTRFIGDAYLGTEPYLIEIGEDCLFTDNLHFHTHDGGVKVLNSLGVFEGERMDKMARIKIGDNCFIGSGTRIMGGVKIGNNVIVGAASVVTKDIPDNCVVAGMPAKVICSIDEFYQKNKKRGNFYPTLGMGEKEKKEYLIKHVTKIF